MTSENPSKVANGQAAQVAPIKPARILASTPANKAATIEALHAEYRPQQVIDESTTLALETALEDKPSNVPTDNKGSATKSKKWWILATLLVVGLGCAELVVAITQVITAADWLGAGWIVLLFVVVAGGVTFVGKELRALKRLKKQTEIRQNSADLFNTPAIGLGQEHCLTIAKQLPEQYQYLVEDWQKNIESHYTNNEILSLFELKVLSPIDKLALGNIGKHASAAGVMIAVSPFALVDMFIVLWRNLVMINQISRFYGLSLGYWGRIALIKKIFRSMLYVGATELLSDAGNYALGVGLTGKISSRVAQGLGAGVLTSRIGLKALNECRPMPWLATTKPGLANMTSKLLEDLTKHIK
jgi:putative membrane protein